MRTTQISDSPADYRCVVVRLELRYTYCIRVSAVDINSISFPYIKYYFCQYVSTLNWSDAQRRNNIYGAIDLRLQSINC